MDPGRVGPRTLEELYAAHHRRLLRLATLLLGDAAQGEDVVQDVFVTLHRRERRSRGGLAEIEDPLAYLHRSVVNTAHSARRRRGLARRHGEGAADPLVPAYAEAADAPLLARVRRRRVLDAVAALPRRQREVVVLRYYLDLSEREIAETLGISTGSVKQHASRGAAALRERLASVLPELQQETR